MSPATSNRLGRLLLAAAAASLAAQGTGWFLAWHEDPHRGLQTTAFAAEWVGYFLEFGLEATGGIPVCHAEPGTPPRLLFNWHHPPFYPLFLALFAAVLGDEPWVLRSAHALLFLPGVVGLHWLVRRFATPLLAAVAVLLFVTSPLVAYLGLMVQQDGASLGLGIASVAAFQAHLDRPRRLGWWWPALWFFLACSNDFPAYFFGLSMFALGLAHPDRRQAVIATARMFGVSLVAFAITALHYGTILGGPLGFLRAMLHMGAGEDAGFTEVDPEGQLARMLHSVLVVHGAGAIVLLGIAGLRWPGPGTPCARLSLLGLALLLPGIATCAAFPFHAVHHEFWSLPAFGGFAVLATGLCAAAIEAMHASGVRRRVGIAVVGLAAAAAVGGVVQTQWLIGRGGDSFSAQVATLAPGMQRTQGCAFVLTSAPVGQGRFTGTEFLVGRVDTPEYLDELLQIGRAAGVRGDIGFLLTPPFLQSPLRTRLRELADEQVAEQVLVYRFPLR